MASEIKSREDYDINECGSVNETANDAKAIDKPIKFSGVKDGATIMSKTRAK